MTKETPLARLARGYMIRGMQSPETTTSSQAGATFAGVLAALAAPGRKPAREWSDSGETKKDGLEDDVATLSYERALRTHARYRPADAQESRFGEVTGSGTLRIREAPVADPAPVVSEKAQTAFDPGADAGPPIAFDAVAQQERNLRSASITIRLSRQESAQLRKRAAEAGLTVSAYLRSCTFEAESLRAMVKDTLAQLRTETSRKSGGKAPAASQGWVRWIIKLWPHGRDREHALRT